MTRNHVPFFDLPPDSATGISLSPDDNDESTAGEYRESESTITEKHAVVKALFSPYKIRLIVISRHASLKRRLNWDIIQQQPEFIC
ncbi:hypothetical protein [Escherichia coli]